MKGLFARQLFTGFGPSLFAPADQPPALYAVQGGRPSRLRAGVRRECPRRPGVYGMIDGAGELIYVGKAKCLRTRLLSYFRPKGRDPKAGRIVGDARAIAWEPAHGEFAALLRELELIRRWRPRFNVQGQPHRRRRAYVCIGREPAPYLFLSPRPPGTAFAGFGPVPGGVTAREAVRRLNDWFRLRDCPQAQKMVFADQRGLFPLDLVAGCLRVEIEACLGPCAAACSRAEYSSAVRAAMRFLEGADASPLETLERDMQAASAAQAFERAAALRDRWKPIHWLSAHLERVRLACRRSCVYPAAGPDGARDHWRLIHQGRVRAVVAAPRNDAERAAAAAALDAIYRGAAAGPPGPDEIDGVLLVAAWFRRHPEEKAKTLTPNEARALCRRGERPAERRLHPFSAVFCSAPWQGEHPMTESDREGFRQRLLTLGNRLKGDVSSLSKEALRFSGGEASGNLSNTPFHTADLGTDNFEQEMSTSLLENQDQILQDIAGAMRRIEEGTYGTCELCSKEIPKQRLLAAPYTPYCIDCARQLEEDGSRGRRAVGL